MIFIASIFEQRPQSASGGSVPQKKQETKNDVLQQPQHKWPAAFLATGACLGTLVLLACAFLDGSTATLLVVIILPSGLNIVVYIVR